MIVEAKHQLQPHESHVSGALDSRDVNRAPLECRESRARCANAAKAMSTTQMSTPTWGGCPAEPTPVYLIPKIDVDSSNQQGRLSPDRTRGDEAKAVFLRATTPKRFER